MYYRKDSKIKIHCMCVTEPNIIFPITKKSNQIFMLSGKRKTNLCNIAPKQ